MGRRNKSTREMNRLIRVLKRNRNLKKASYRTFPRPEGLAEQQPMVAGEPMGQRNDAPEGDDPQS